MGATVLDEVGVQAEATATLGTGVRFLASMYPVVLNQI